MTRDVATRLRTPLAWYRAVRRQWKLPRAPLENDTTRSDEVPGQIFENAGFLFAANTLARALRVILALLIARHLGLTDFGILAFVSVYVEIFRVVADFGIDTVLTRHLSARVERAGVVGSAAAIKLLLGSTAYILGLVIAVAVKYPPATLGLLAIGLTGLFTALTSNLLAAPFQSVLRVRRIAWTGVMGTGIFALLAAAGVRGGQGVLYFVLVGPLSELFGIALAISVFAREAQMRWGGWSLAKDLVREALPIGAITVVVIGYGRFGMLFLERVREPAEVGAYAIGLRIIEIPLLLAAALASSAYPALARLLSARKLSAALALYRGLQRHFVAGATVVALLMTLFSSMILGLIGSGFAVAGPVLVTLAWAAVFMFVNQLSGALLLAAGRSPTVLMVAIWNLFLNVAMNVQLVPRFGARGVALALLMTEAGNTVVQSVLVGRQFRLIPAISLWVRSAAAGLLALVLVHDVPMLTLAVFALYLGSAVRFGDLSVRWMLGKAGSPSHRLSE